MLTVCLCDKDHSCKYRRAKPRRSFLHCSIRTFKIYTEEGCEWKSLLVKNKQGYFLAQYIDVK